MNMKRNLYVMFSATMVLGYAELLRAEDPAKAQDPSRPLIVTQTAEEPGPLWDPSKPVPKRSELPLIPGVRFSVIKPYEFQKDGYRFLHGVAVAWYKEQLFASFGHNKEGENTPAEEARYRISSDDGKTWGEVRTIDSGKDGIGVSHGVLAVHQGKLWSFNGSYHRGFVDTATRAYTYNDDGTWEAKGIVIGGGFWALQAPIKMVDGNWIMSGVRLEKYRKKGINPPAVAISHGDDFMKWDLVMIPVSSGAEIWGESVVIVNGKQVINIARYGAEAKALMARSEDAGRTWTEARPSNLPMATSKPCAGTLSTGQNYLICTTSADSNHARTPLTIAVTRPGESVFKSVFMIRPSLFPQGLGESHPQVYLSYPDAVEHNGYLYVGYSNSGGKVGRVGSGTQQMNNNSAELAVIPIKNLSVQP